MIKLMVVTWLLAVHSLLVLALIHTDLAYRIDRKLGLGYLQPPELTSFYHNMLGSHLSLDGTVSSGSILFFGDSITQGLNVSGFKRPAINYGIGMDTSWGLLERLPKYASQQQASAIVIAIGINDLLRTKRSNQEVIHNYQRIFTYLPTEVPVFIQAILPVDEQHTQLGLNARILKLNTSLQKLAQQHQFIFIDLHHQLVNSQGNLRAEFHTGDGLHLSPAAYRLWIELLQQYLGVRS